MAQGVSDAEKERDEQRKHLGTSVKRLEDRVRSELDWKLRLREEGPRIVVVTLTTASVIMTLVAIRKLLNRKHTKQQPAALPMETSVDDLVAELHEMRNQIAKLRVKQKSGLGITVAGKLATAAGAAAGTKLMNELMERHAQGNAVAEFSEDEE